MTALELQKRKSRALEVLQACNSEDAIAHIEALARKLMGREKQTMKRPNCFTLDEVKEMLKETNQEKNNNVYVSEQEMHDFLQSLK